MSVLALITLPNQIRQVISWAAEFASALDSPLTVLCWAPVPSSHADTESAVGASLLSGVKRYVEALQRDASPATRLILKQASIRPLQHPQAHIGASQIALREDAQLIVATAVNPSGNIGANYLTNPLLRRSPCNTVILLGGLTEVSESDRILVASTDSPHDNTALFLASRLAQNNKRRITLARIERDFDGVGRRVGLRDLQRLIRTTSIQDDAGITCQILPAGNPVAATNTMNAQDLVLVGANRRQVSKIIDMPNGPTIGIVKRAPAARPWRKSSGQKHWLSRLSEADYADLYDGLRRGSRLDVDFMTMLCLAAIVASIGLLQDSPAVVIGSMLLAPLMTPMLGCGLALAQANPSLGNRALISVVIGLLCTLAISAAIGWLTPVENLTRQILARGDPTALDLFVASASAVAAAYALARPSLAGTIAGVAIATALVPPLCAMGLSLAYENYVNAQGAALLFGTNFIAIVLSAALTFRAMGVSWSSAGYHQRAWVLRIGVLMTAAAIAIALPLYFALQKSILQATPIPITYPLARSVIKVLEKHVAQYPDIELLMAGRPSVPLDGTDVQILLGTPRALEPSFAEPLIGIVRREMQDDSLSVKVHCIRELWQVRDD